MSSSSAPHPARPQRDHRPQWGRLATLSFNPTLKTMTAVVDTTNVQKLVDIAIVHAQKPDAGSGVEEGVIGHTPSGEPIACGVYWTSESTSHGSHRKAHIESIECEPEPDAVIDLNFDHFRSSELEDVLWDAEDELSYKGMTFSDVIRESGVEYADPDVEAKWKGGEKRNARQCYWIEDVKALIQYIRAEHC